MSFKINISGDPLESSVEVDLVGINKAWHIPQEVPVAFVYNRRNYAVMMATPDNLVDFAIGFSLTERVVSELCDIISLDIQRTSQGVNCRFKISAEKLDKLEMIQRRRNMIGSASCGLCGLANVDTLFEILPKVAQTPLALQPSAMTRAMEKLKAHQTVNQKTRSVHAAAWVDLKGEIQCVREDVGRHNALDKLLGALAMTGIECCDGFILMSSRCSYEIVEKAARRGVQAIVSISGPTALALQKAKQANLALYARSIDQSGQYGTVRLS